MMQFVESDTLAELVWSPRTGLNIKFAEEKPCFMWEVGATDMRLENTQNEQHIASLATCHVSCTGSQNQGSGTESRPPLRIEPVMQCRPGEHVKRANVEIDNVKRKRDFERLILKSKRIKNQADGSSFMNWISNTLKGLKNHNYDQQVGGFESRHFGFHTVFESLFSPETIKQFESRSVGNCSSKETGLTEKCSRGSLGYLEIKDKENVKDVCFYERVTIKALKDTFDTIRKLRLSRTDIIKWMNSKNSRSFVKHNLDGFFLRLRVAKWEEGAGRSRYYVACITGSQGEISCKDLKQSIRVKVGDVECLVQSQHVSNCDFLEDELIAWWEKTSKNGAIPAVKDLKSKLAERRTLGM